LPRLKSDADKVNTYAGSQVELLGFTVNDLADMFFAAFCYVILSASLLACSSEKNDVEPALLIAGVQSYLSIESFLKANPSAIIVKDSIGHRTNFWRPQFKNSEVKMTNFEHMGNEGELSVMFYNDKLMSTVFYPKDFDAYLVQLNHAGINLGPDNVIKSKHVIIRSGSDYSGNQYVSWSDKGLHESFNHCIKENA